MKEIKTSEQKSGPSVGEARGAGGACAAAALYPSATPQVNDVLNSLARAPKREDKVRVLRPLLDRMDPLQVKWLCAIILRDMKIGVTEKTVLKEFHVDAELAFNNCCDLRKARPTPAPAPPSR